jgi:hypothetical protein
MKRAFSGGFTECPEQYCSAAAARSAPLPAYPNTEPDNQPVCLSALLALQQVTEQRTELRVFFDSTLNVAYRFLKVGVIQNLPAELRRQNFL